MVRSGSVFQACDKCWCIFLKQYFVLMAVRFIFPWYTYCENGTLYVYMCLQSYWWKLVKPWNWLHKYLFICLACKYCLWVFQCNGFWLCFKEEKENVFLCITFKLGAIRSTKLMNFILSKLRKKIIFVTVYATGKFCNGSSYKHKKNLINRKINLFNSLVFFK